MDKANNEIPVHDVDLFKTYIKTTVARSHLKLHLHLSGLPVNKGRKNNSYPLKSPYQATILNRVGEP